MTPERKLSFDEWSALDWPEQSKVTTNLSVEALEAFVQECEKRATALPLDNDAHDLWNHWNNLKYNWFIKKHPECITHRPDGCMELLASKVEASVEILEDFVSLNPSPWGVGRLMLPNARAKLDVMKHPERVFKLPNGNVLILDPGRKGCGQIYTPDLNEWAGDVFTPENGPPHKTPEPRPSWMRETPVPVPERFRQRVQGDATVPVVSQATDSEGMTSRTAEFALATSLGEAKYDTDEVLREAWRVYIERQGFHLSPEELRKRFVNAYAAWRTRRLDTVDSGDVAFLQARLPEGASSVISRSATND